LVSSISDVAAADGAPRSSRVGRSGRCRRPPSFFLFDSGCSAQIRHGTILNSLQDNIANVRGQARLFAHRYNEARSEFTTALQLDTQLYQARYNLLRVDEES
jgi:hypothetical protein